jgi:predicted RNA-binding Zn-ribbon protein involved in translation (DUF1610 family)
MKCSNCLFENPDDADFCVEYDASIEFDCPICGAITIRRFECQMIALMR